MFYNLQTYLKITFAIHFWYWITINQIHHLVKRGSLKDVIFFCMSCRKSRTRCLTYGPTGVKGLRGTKRNTSSNLLLRAQNLNVILILNELDTNASQACYSLYLSGVSIAVKQVMPDHVLVRTPLGKITNRNIPLSVFGLTFIMWALGNWKKLKSSLFSGRRVYDH